MIDAKVLEGVKALIATCGRLTCGALAEKLQMPPSSMVDFLRDAVDVGMLTECNGFYDVPRPRPRSAAGGKRQEPGSVAPVEFCHFRKSLPWIEGKPFRHWLKILRWGPDSYLIVDRSPAPEHILVSVEVA